MAELNFAGDLNGLSDQQLEFISDLIVELEFNEKKVTFHPVGDFGDNFMANVKRIIIENENETFSMIAKIAPKNETVRQQLNISSVFNNEHVIYTELMPILEQLQRDAGVPEEELFQYPKCYGSLNEQPNEIILIEDLTPLGFDMYKSEVLSNNCVRNVLRNLAIWHSLSYALKYKEPEHYELFKTRFVDIRSEIASAPWMGNFLEQLEADVLSLIEDTDLVGKVRDKLTDFMQLNQKFSRLDLGSKYSVIQHGDAWKNNIMFRLENGTPGDDQIGSVLIDYKQAKISNPVLDILYLIFNCTDYETRAQHFQQWIDYYHAELEKSLSNFELKINLVYPKNVLEADIRRYGKLLFVNCILFASLSSQKSKEAGNIIENSGNDTATMVEALKLKDSADETVFSFKKRVNDLVNSFEQFGLL